MIKTTIVVTHLLGSGHLARALVLGKAFTKAGHKTTVISGGMPVPHLDTGTVEFVQLPPLRSDGTNFTTLLDETGAVADANTHGLRRTALKEALAQSRPEVLITELYPFGRRVLKEEFRELLENAQKLQPVPPLICASIRDILAPPSKPSKVQEAAHVLNTYYDCVLVHSDETLTPLQASWPVTDDLKSKLHYTGYVSPLPPEAHPKNEGMGEILVSAGGGNVGTSIYRAALTAAGLDPLRRTWRLLVGGSGAQERCNMLAKHAPTNAVVETARPDFRNMLNHAEASVSMCGYNTALDILQTDVPAVFIPFDAGNEVEQTLRASALSHLDGIEVLAEHEMTAELLLDRISLATSAPKRDASHFRFDGSKNTVRHVETLLHNRMRR